MPFPLYDDENAMDRVLFQMLVESSVDCLTSNDVENSGKSDSEQLAFATAVGRTVVTYDRADFQRLHGQWANAGRNHCGIIVITRQRMARSLVFARLMRLQAERTPDQMRNAILFVNPNPIEEPS